MGVCYGNAEVYGKGTEQGKGIASLSLAYACVLFLRKAIDAVASGRYARR